MQRAFEYTFGALDGISLDGDMVTARGWAVGLDGNVTGLQIDCEEEALDLVDLSLNVPSADVVAVHPQLPHAPNCRFEAKARLRTSPVSGQRPQLFSVVPFVQGRPGVPMDRAIPLHLPVATPDQSVSVGHGDFVDTSFSMLGLFRTVAGLRRNARILEPGCGLGRMAYALAHYLDADGRYDGFDVSAESIRIARVNFAAAANFAFRHVDLYNKMYNPGGTIRARDFEFPFPARHFDLTILTSVFTHMMPADVRQFLAEIARTLDHDGVCLATFFVIDDVARTNLAAGTASLPIVHACEPGCFVENPQVPEAAVGYDYAVLAGMIEAAGLKVEQFHPGKWSGRQRFLSYQDVLLLTK